MMRFLCALGIHKYGLREVHLCEEWKSNIFNAAIIEKCDVCGESSITSKEKKTCFMVSTKYIEGGDLDR